LGYHSGLLSSDFLRLPAISKLDILKAIQRLRHSKSAGVDGLRGFLMEGSSTIFTPLLKYIFDLSLSREQFRTQCKQAVTVPILKKAEVLPLVIIDRISLLNTFPKFLN
jgi:hypothetical protein